MDLDAFRWLLTAPGQQLLTRAQQLIDAGAPALRAGEQLRRGHDVDRVAAALTQLDLRVRAEPKFGDLAPLMYFTPDGLEQATRLPVATHRAGRMAAADPVSLVDLGCGIGGDLVAFARTGITTAGIDLDPLRVAVAQANLDALGLAGAVRQGDATTLDTDLFDVAFADPARRTGAGRSFDVDAWLPPWSFVRRLLQGPACVKVAPGIPHSLVPEGVEAEWVSDHGDLKEASLWSGPLASTRRRATVIGDGGLATLTEDDDPGGEVRELGRFLYEPDDAVIRAGLVTAVADGVDGGLLDAKIAYVTSDASFRTPFARGYRVLEEVPFREKALRAALRERRVGSLTIKKRGVQVAPEQLRRRLGLTGDRDATLVLTRSRAGSQGGSQGGSRSRGVALLVEPF